MPPRSYSTNTLEKKESLASVGSTVGHAKRETLFTPDQVLLAWKNITYQVSKSEREGCKRTKKRITILDNLSGYLQPGTVTAILGPSGAGKSSLLDLISGRTIAKHQGTVTLNGKPRDKSFKTYIGYVTQDERALIGALTVRENLLYAARLRLPSSIPDAVKAARVDDVIRTLGLSHVADTIVGTPFKRGISGGQKRRVSIGLELLKKPSILFLDEPTSGLDSAAATQVMEVIRELAVNNGIAVLATIHQPRSTIFAEFHNVCLLAKGKMVYFGAVNEMQKYFADLGKPLPINCNPADHYVDCVNADFGGLDDIERIVNNWSQRRNKELEDEVTFLEEKFAHANRDKEVVKAKSYQTGFFLQTLWLIARNFATAKQDPLAYMIRIVMITFGGVLIGSLWYKIPNSTERAGDYYGIAFYVALINIFTALNSLPQLIEERNRFIHEYATGYYRWFPWYLAQLITACIFLFLNSLFFCAVTYFMVGITIGADRFFIYVAMIYLVVLIGEGFTLILGLLIPNVASANAIGVVFFGIMGMVSGVFISESDMPRYWFWICWIAPFKYAVQLFMLVQYKDVDEVECISSATQLCPPPESGSDTSYVTGADILDQFDLELNEYYYGFLGLIIIFLVYRTVVLVLVRQLAVSTMNKKS